MLAMKMVMVMGMVTVVMLMIGMVMGDAYG